MELLLLFICLYFVDDLGYIETKSNQNLLLCTQEIVLLFLVALSTILSVEVLLNYGFDHWEMIAPFKLFSFLVIYVG